MIENPLRSYLNLMDENPFQFAKRSGIPSATIHRIVQGKSRPYRTTAKKICKYSNGRITLLDFGYEE